MATPYATTVRDELGIPYSGLLVDLRALLLRPQGVTHDTACAVNHFIYPLSIRQMLDLHVNQRLLRSAASSYLPTARGEDVLRRLGEGLALGLAKVWQDIGALRTAGDLLFSVADYAAETCSASDSPAFTAKYSTLRHNSSLSAFTVWSGIDALRYYRADAHVCAWRDTGLRPRTASTLDAAWRTESMGETSEEDAEELANRG